MVKNLLPLIQENPRWNQEGGNSHDNNRNLNNEEGHALIEMQTLSNGDPFFDRLEEITHQIDQIASNNDTIEDLQRRVWIGVNQDQVEIDRTKLNRISNESRSLGIKIRDFLRSEQNAINKKEKELEEVEDKSTRAKEIYDTEVKGTQIAAQSRRFYQEWEKLNALQSLFRDQMHTHFRRQCKIINANLTNEEIEKLLDEGDQRLNFSILVSNEKATQHMREQVSDLEKRRDQFLNLEEAIKEIRDLFLEMADLVYNQGEMINNIERNVDVSVVYVKEGTKELEEAVNIKRDTRKHQVICGSIIIAVILILVIIIVGVPTSSSKQSSESTPMKEETTTQDINLGIPTEPHDIKPSIIPPLEPSIEPPIY